MDDQARQTGPEAPPERGPLYAGARGTAVKVLNRVDRTDSYLDKVLDNELRGTELNDLDKGLLTEIAHGVLRWQGRLDWILNGFSHGNFAKSEINVRNALRVALYQILFLERVPNPAAVNEAVEFVKRVRGEKPAGLVNAVLRNIIRNIDGIRYPDPAADRTQHLAVYWSHPHWMVRRWVERFGEEQSVELMRANNERPHLSLRVNATRTDLPAVLRELERQDVRATPSPYVSSFIRVKSLSRIGQMELFRKGFFTIQDESAALPTLLLDPRPGERILDLCAAPGGKTTHIAELLGNTGEVIALDKYDAKVRLIRGACERLGLRNVRIEVADAVTFAAAPFDRVLLDAPCSGLGVLAKKPDMKWKRDPTDLLHLVDIQEQLLESAARLVRPGGVVVYSTCTIEPEENQERITAFLDRHPDFRLDDAHAHVARDLVSPEGYVMTYPHRHGMDGSFAARLVRGTGQPPHNNSDRGRDHGHA